MGIIIGIVLGIFFAVLTMSLAINSKDDDITIQDCLDINEHYGTGVIISNGVVIGFVCD